MRLSCGTNKISVNPCREKKKPSDKSNCISTCLKMPKEFKPIKNIPNQRMLKARGFNNKSMFFCPLCLYFVFLKPFPYISSLGLP